MQVERGTGKVRRSKTNVLPLYHATNLVPVFKFPLSIPGAGGGRNVVGSEGNCLWETVRGDRGMFPPATLWKTIGISSNEEVE